VTTWAKLLIKDIGSTPYRSGVVWDTLYQIAGDDISWMHAELGVMSYIIELNSRNQGFQPD